jgi:hypothetical protein
MRPREPLPVDPAIVAVAQACIEHHSVVRWHLIHKDLGYVAFIDRQLADGRRLTLPIAHPQMEEAMRQGKREPFTTREVLAKYIVEHRLRSGQALALFPENRT